MKQINDGKLSCGIKGLISRDIRISLVWILRERDPHFCTEMQTIRIKIEID